MPMSPSKTTDPSLALKESIDQILEERFVHSSSHLIYDKIPTLWHMDDKEGQESLSFIACKVVIGLFCLEYLSHLDKVLREEAGIKKGITASDLTNEALINKMKERLSGVKGITQQIKEVISFLKDFMDSVDTKDLEELTRIAHTGDYLLSSLDDLKESKHQDYTLWLYSIPHYYGKDLRYQGLLKETGIPLQEAISNLEEYMPIGWQEQIPIEVLHLQRIPSDHRLNLNSLSSGDGYFPCTPSGKTKGKKAHPRPRVTD